MKLATYEMNCDGADCDLREVGMVIEQLNAPDSRWHVAVFDGCMTRDLCDLCFEKSLELFVCPPPPKDEE